jgi:hypothetical protein
MLATVLRFATVTAATGTTATPPAAPACALLLITLLELAVTLIAPLLLIAPCAGGAPTSPMNACVVSSITLTATEAPTPTLEPVVVPLAGCALALSVLLLDALRVIAPPPVVVRLAPLLT